MTRTKTGTVDRVRLSDGTLVEPPRFRARLTINGTRETVGTFDNEEDAELAIDAAIEVLTESGADGATVGTYVDGWLTRREVNGHVRDPGSERSRFKNHIEADPIAKIPLGGLRRGDVKAWVRRVRAKTAAQSTRNTLMILRGALADALDEGRIKVNIAAEHKVSRDKRTDEPWSFLTPPEQTALMQAVPEPDRWIVGFAIGSGLRAGELVALRAVDVHAKDGYITVRFGGAPAEPTKTGKIRRVEIVGVTRDALERWQAPARNPHGLVFPRPRGGFRDDAHILRWENWKGYLKAAGITRRLRWHDLRHTCASSLISGWWGRAWSLEQVKAQLGHTSIKTTERYAHLAQDSVKKAAEETASVWPALSQVPVTTSMSNVFLNRRSSDHARSGAPGGIATEITTAASCRAGQLLATSRALLEAAARGDEKEAWRLADDLRSGGLTRALELAEAVLDSHMSAGRVGVVGGGES